ncbi:CHAT domain-containing protein [Actinokineospora sp. 24-640]
MTVDARKVFERCQATVERAFAGDAEPTAVAAFTADLMILPRDTARSRLAATMVVALTRSPNRRIDLFPAVGALLDLVEEVPLEIAGVWGTARAVGRACWLAHAAATGQVDLAAADRELAELAEQVGDDPLAALDVKGAREAVRAAIGFRDGDESAILRMTDQMRAMLDSLGDHPTAIAMRRFVDRLLAIQHANRDGDDDTVVKDSAAFLELVAGLPEEWGLRNAIGDSARYLDIFLNGANGGEPPGIRNDPGLVADPLAHIAAAGALFDGGKVTDLARLDTAIEHSREAVALSGNDADRAFALISVALGLIRRAEVTGDIAGWIDARGPIEDAVRLIKPKDPLWPLANRILGAVRQRTGDLPGAAVVQHDAQIRYVYQALVETDPAGARIALRSAAEEAIDTVVGCLQADDLESALRAAETGRGLMLYAEVELRGIAERLTEVGRADLARRWADGADPGVRREVVDILVENSAGALIAPPTIPEIRSALAATDVDALVYLIPAAPQRPGMALVAPRTGPPACVYLPHLRVESDAEVERYLSTLARGARELAPIRDTALNADIDALCRWAWKAAIGPLLENYLARRLPDRGDQVPRVVLIPMGDLARIPWQAARRHDGVYAVELAAFSQAASARLFCANAALPPIAPGRTGLVIGDPDTGGAAVPLAAARVEAHALRQAFYPGARYIGRRPDGSTSPSGAGTAEQVRAWIADTQPQAGALLHLACHGAFTAGADSAKACLLLAVGADGTAGELNADEIVRLLDAAPGRGIGIVVMAACHTGRSIHGYDEAYSLGTAFLAAGVRTVLSTQWAVPDEATSALMFLFHHYLREEGLPPWQALRRAQMWMLDPRETPARMPEALRSMVAAHDSRQVAAWAGFVHGGH